MDGDYTIHHNGARPFQVRVRGNKVSVHRLIVNNTYNYDNDYDDYEDRPMFEWYVEDVFVGHDEEDEENPVGNTVLVQLPNNNYIFIGLSIFSFRTHSSIIDFFTPIGNNDVPYPYAIDEEGNYYLFVEKVILPQYRFIEEDPYDVYYNNRINNAYQLTTHQLL